MLTGQGGGSPRKPALFMAAVGRCGLGRGLGCVVVFISSWLAGLATANASEPPLLTTAAAIAQSSLAEDAEPPPVRLQAVVTFTDRDGGIFLRDATGSTFILAQSENPHLPPGTRVLVEGVLHRGLFINGIRHSRIERLGTGPVPEPKPITPQLMAAGVLHYDLVTLTGVGRSWRRTSETTAELELNVDGRVVEVRLENLAADAMPPDLIGAGLRVVGLAAGEINDRRQLIRPYLLVSGLKPIELIDPAPADPFAIPETAFASLGRGEPNDRLQRVTGLVVAAPRQRQLFLSDGDAGLAVELATAAGEVIRPGDRVEVVGFAAAGPFATRLAEARLRVLSSGEPVVARRPTAAELFLGCDGQLIEVEAEVAERDELAGSTRLVLRLGGLSLRVLAPGRLAAAIVPATTVRVTAPCLATEMTNSRYSLRATSYDLLPRSMDDVVLVAGPPWWTPRRLAVALAASLTVGGVALAWVVLLRRQVGRQLSLIERQIQQEAVAAERQRIAREFHDSLEQDLAGLALRIDSAAATVADPDARGTMERQRQILTRLQHETRQYVWDLREPARLQGSLADRVRALLAELRELVATPLTLEVAGSLPLLPPETTYQLLRMLREAVNNAAHHANATSITVGLAADGQGVVATVTDDGAGFEPAADGVAPAGHFGLRGLTERAARIAADVQIASQPGQGTVVTIHVPQPG